MDKKRKDRLRLNRFNKHEDQLTDREMDRNVIRECQWRYIYNRVIIALVPLVNRYDLDTLPHTSPLTDKYYNVIEHLITILFEEPIKDLQRVREEQAEVEVYATISQFVSAATNYDISESSGVGLFLKSALFTLKHGLFIGKLTRNLMEIYDDTVFFYKMRDNYYIDQNGYVALSETVII